ncbi:fibronectin type III domain-containing protein [Thermaurantiacus sp.]
MRLWPLLSAFLALQLFASQPAGADVLDLSAVEKAPRAPGRPYAPRALPDRIVLAPGADPSREMAVSWRTDAAQTIAEAEIAPLRPAPNFGLGARAVRGESVETSSENGAAVWHRARFSGLSPGTAYAYRVKGAGGWSEWQQFRTAAEGPEPFRFIYLGDTQNGILSLASLAWRRALLMAGDPALMLHAGDLVDQRDDLVPDDEWGEWNAAGGWALATVPQLVAAGNHEYVMRGGVRELGRHWPLQFALPDNGAPGVERTSYAVDWQGVRFIMLDGTSALELGTLAAQTAWLEAQLQRPKLDWTVVTFHQPIFTCARPQDTPKLKEAWVPLFERHGVDLVLQGHDHCYSRLTAAKGREASAKARKAGRPQGPVYLVSVAGSKQYGLNDRADRQPDRAAEDSMLFQIVEVERARLTLRAFTADGALYDGFTLARGRDGRNRLSEVAPLPAERRCRDGRNADGFPCTARKR